MRLLTDITDMSMAATSQIFVAGPRHVRTRRPARTVVGFVLMSLALTFGIQRVVMAAPLGGSEHGKLLVQGVDGNGRVSSSSPVIDVSGAYPGDAREDLDVRGSQHGNPAGDVRGELRGSGRERPQLAG